MKKIFLFAAATAVALSSCSKNEVTENLTTADNAIGFSNYIGNSTRASVAETTTVNAANSVMGVYASYEATKADAVIAPNFMKDVAVSWQSSGSWTYSPLKYWPTSGGVIDFYAYWPKNATYTADATAATGGPIVTFTQDDALANMQDFLYSNVADQKREQLTSTGTQAKVQFTFKHALSRIAFSARPEAGLADATDKNSTFITVTGLKVTPKASTVVNKGNLSFAMNSTDTDQTDGVMTAVTGTYHAAAWTLAVTDGVNLYDGTASATLAQSDADTNFPLSTDSEYIFIVPQDFDAADYMTVEVKYTITTFDDGLDADKSEVTDNIKTVQMPAMTFAQGVAYNFPIVIGLDAIEFDDVIVSDWPGDAVQTGVEVL